MKLQVPECNCMLAIKRECKLKVSQMAVMRGILQCCVREKCTEGMAVSRWWDKR